MENKHQSILRIVFLLAIILSFTDAFDCYFCANCANSQRGVPISTLPGDWCYKVVWRSRAGKQQTVSRGASADCRQDSYKNPGMSIPGLLSGTARYCCRNHLCNSAPKCIHYPFLFALSFALFFL